MSETLSRRLGFVESFFAELHDNLVGSTQVVSAAQLRGKVNTEAVRQALEILYQRHPLLRMGLTQEGGEWWFVPAGSFDDVSVTIRSFEEVGEWRRGFEQELDYPVPTSGPLWRATLLTNGRHSESTLLLTLHHAITDGLSAVALSRQFVAAYNLLAQGLEPETERFSLRAPVESLLASAESDNPSAEPSSMPAAAQWQYEASAPFAQRKARVLWRTFDPSETEALIKRCQAEQTSVNAAIVAALIVAAQRLPTRDATVPCVIPTDVRQRVQPPISPEENGAFFREVLLTFDAELAALDPWERARRIRARYLEQLGPALAASPSSSASDVAAAVAPALDPNAGIFGQGFVVTNLGRQDAGEPRTPLRFASFQAATSPRSGGLTSMVFVTTLDDSMSFAFTTADPLLGENSAKEFADTLMASMRQSLRM